eukprot:scaffold302168_cov61-Attheya_sp.AAC.2
MDQPIQYEQPCQRFPVRGCGYETCQSLPMLRPAELTEDWKIGSRRGRLNDGEWRVPGIGFLDDVVCMARQHIAHIRESAFGSQHISLDGSKLSSLIQLTINYGVQEPCECRLGLPPLGSLMCGKTSADELFFYFIL